MTKLAVLLCAGSVVLAAGAAAAAKPPRGEFVFVDETVAGSPAFGTLLICPSHAYGTLDDAENVLKKKLADFPADRQSTIVVCRSDQSRTVKRFASKVDRIVVNPFLTFNESELAPEADPAVWPKSEHMILRRLRQLRAEGGDSSLLAIIDLQGEKSLFGTRRPSFEEVEWQVLAAVGAGFQGIVWRPQRDNVFEGRLARLEASLNAHAKSLSTARPVPWARARDKSQPVSALRSGDRLFVVLLNPTFMNPAKRGAVESSTVELPLDPQPVTVDVECDLPAGVRLGSATTLAGRAVRVEADGPLARIRQRLTGGGEIVVYELAGAGQAAGASTRDPAIRE